MSLRSFSAKYVAPSRPASARHAVVERGDARLRERGQLLHPVPRQPCLHARVAEPARARIAAAEPPVVVEVAGRGDLAHEAVGPASARSTSIQ